MFNCDNAGAFPPEKIKNDVAIAPVFYQQVDREALQATNADLPSKNGGVK